MANTGEQDVFGHGGAVKEKMGPNVHGATQEKPGGYVGNSSSSLFVTIVKEKDKVGK